MGHGISSQEWFNIVVPVGLILCCVTFGLMRRFEWIGLFLVLFLVGLVIVPLIAYLIPALRGSGELAQVLWRVSWLTAACGAMCAEFARYEDRKRRRAEEQQAMREEHRRHLERNDEQAS